MRISLVVVLVAATAHAPAIADAGEIRLDVELGKTVERDVAIATGWFCDDPALVNAELVTRGERNYWRVTGAKLGATKCRVGTDPTRVSFVFDLHVVPAQNKR